MVMVAVGSGFWEVVKLLLSQKQIDLDTRDEKGMTLKDKANEYGLGNIPLNILMCLRNAERKRVKRREEIEDQLKKKEEIPASKADLKRPTLEKNKVGLGKGRNARRRRNEEKLNGKNNKNKVDDDSFFAGPYSFPCSSHNHTRPGHAGSSEVSSGAALSLGRGH